jgi:exosortase family protein XrtF
MNRRFIVFIITTVGLYLLWFVLYEFFLKPNGKLDHLITENISIAICSMLSDYNCYYTIGNHPGETYIFFGDNVLPVVRIGASCNGLEMLILFAIFIICYPGNFLVKIIYTSIGLVIIHALNIFRNYILALLAFNQSPSFELFHRYIFIFLLYGVIFILWVLWAKILSKIQFNNA